MREVCRDLLFHQNAFLDAMAAAFAEFAEQFDPDELQANFDRTLSRKPLIGALNQLKYWQMYSELYPVLVESGGSRFPQALAEEFVSAYERAINDAKRNTAPAAPKPGPAPANRSPQAAEPPDAGSKKAS